MSSSSIPYLLAAARALENPERGRLMHRYVNQDGERCEQRIIDRGGDGFELITICNGVEANRSTVVGVNAEWLR